MNTLKRSRSGRASSSQLSAMLDFMEQNKGTATGKFHGINGKEIYRQKWAELAKKLNSIHGAQKTVPQWQVTWRDIKSRACIKVKNIQTGRAAIENKSMEEMELTPFDIRVIGIIGPNYVEGSADSGLNQSGLKRKLEQRTAETNKRNHPTVHDPLNTECEEFASVSHKHADAMQVMASAMQKQAEALAVFANAADKQAEAALQQAANDSARITVLQNLTNILTQILPDYSTL